MNKLCHCTVSDQITFRRADKAEQRKATTVEGIEKGEGERDGRHLSNLRQVYNFLTASKDFMYTLS